MKKDCRNEENVVARIRSTFKIPVYITSVSDDDYKEMKRVAKEREIVTQAMRKFSIEGPEARYDMEYSTAAELTVITQVPCEFIGTHYWFWSPILDSILLSSIIGKENIGEKMILDVGAGNGTLIQALQSIGSDGRLIMGIDISSKAIDRIRETGATAIHGSLTNQIRTIPKSDLIFLSYFVDRDRDQLGTFREAARLLNRGGTLVLEGLFPCVMTDSSGVSYGAANVTQGHDEVEDMQLIVAELAKLGVGLKRIIIGKRFVYSLDGSEILPTNILVFNKPAI